ncbi:MAG: hypothetical protein WCD79_05120 [Chthoniobacteraceae bacterium]
MKSIVPLMIALLALACPLTSSAGDNGTTDAAVYYLTQRISITNDSGIFSLAPGTKLFVTSKVADGIRAKTEDGMVVQVKLNQVTTDPGAATRLAQQEADDAAARQAKAAAAAQALADQQQQADLKQQQFLDQIAALSATSGTTSFARMPGSDLDNQPPATYKLNLPPKKKK